MEDGRFKKALKEALSVEECDEYVAFERGGSQRSKTDFQRGFCRLAPCTHEFISTNFFALLLAWPMF